MPRLALLALAACLLSLASAGAIQPAPRDLPPPLPPALPVVPGLNSDFLDDRSAADFAAAAHDHDARYYTEPESDARFAAAGHDHDQRYLGIGAPAADSALLDGLDSAAFAAAGHDHDGHLTDAEGDARYAPLDHGHGGAPRVTVCGIANSTRSGVGGWNAIHWTAANCTDGVPTTGCAGMLSQASAYGSDQDWAVLAPGEAAPFSGTVFPTGGVQYWLGTTGAGTFVRAVYLC